MALIKIQRGQSVRWRMTISQDGVPVDLTGGSWEVLEPTSKPSVQILVEDAPTGLSYLTITKDETKTLRVGEHTIRARFVFPDGTAIAHPAIVYEVA